MKTKTYPGKPVEEVFPRVCPKCKSPYWDKPRRLTTRKQDMDSREKEEAKVMSVENFACQNCGEPYQAYPPIAHSKGRC